MGQVSLPHPLTDGTPQRGSEVKADLDAIVAEVNGGLDNSNIDPAGAIEESKLLFATDGHGHTGGTDGKNLFVAASSTLGMVKIQTGSVNVLAGSVSAEIPFTTTFSAGYPFILLKGNDPDAVAGVISPVTNMVDGLIRIYARDITVDSFKIENFYNAPLFVYWMAIGI